MTDVSKLVIKVDSKDVKKATDDLEKLGYEAKVTENKTGGLTKGAKLLGVAFGAVGAVQLTREFVRLADSMTNMENLLKVTASEGENLAETMDKLTEAAVGTRSNLESTVSLYTKLKQSTGELGLSQDELLTITEAVNQSFIVSGAGADEAAGAIKQLSQALASGAFRGDEFNSVAENAPRLMQALSDSLGVTIGELREMAAQGELTSKVLADSLLTQADKIGQEFSGLSITVDQASTNLSTAMTVFIGRVNEATGASSKLAVVIDAIAQRLADPTLFKTDDPVEQLKRLRAELKQLQDAKEDNWFLAGDVFDFKESGIIAEIDKLEKALGGVKTPSEILSSVYSAGEPFDYIGAMGVDSEKLSIELEQSELLLNNFNRKVFDEQVKLKEKLLNQKPELDPFIASFGFDSDADPLKDLGIDDVNIFKPELLMPLDPWREHVSEYKDIIFGLSEAQATVAASMLNSFQTVTDGLLASMDEQSDAYKLVFYANKAASAAQAVVNAHLAKTEADKVDLSGTLGNFLLASGYASAGIIAGTAIKGQRAEGGTMTAGGSYIINEREQEIFAPNQNGRMFNQDDLRQMVGAGSGSSNVNLTVQTPDADSFDMWLDNNVEKLARRISFMQQNGEV